MLEIFDNSLQSCNIFQKPIVIPALDLTQNYFYFDFEKYDSRYVKSLRFDQKALDFDNSLLLRNLFQKQIVTPALDLAQNYFDFDFEKYASSYVKSLRLDQKP